MNGRGGDDTLEGGQGADKMLGGEGKDTASYATASAAVVASLSNPSINSGDAAGDSYSSIENLSGSGFNDVLNGNSGVNDITGGDGADSIKGYLGIDTLAGGAGGDKFIFNTAPNTTTNYDRITDFSVPGDTILLDNAVFAALVATGTLAASAFHIGSTAQDASDRIIYNPATGNVAYDADGTGVTAGVRFANIDKGLALTNADFVII